LGSFQEPGPGWALGMKGASALGGRTGAEPGVAAPGFQLARSMRVNSPGSADCGAAAGVEAGGQAGAGVDGGAGAGRSHDKPG